MWSERCNSCPRQSGFVEQSVRTYVEPHLEAQPGVADPNPLTKDVMLKYKTMFRHVKAACTNVLREHQIFLTDGDIAFIVLYFQTAYERRIDQHRWRALAVCGTGRERPSCSPPLSRAS